MTYDFLIKAKEQPDLNDFCEYLNKPLSILEEIQRRYKQLQLTKKVEPENLETYHKVDVILEKHLPEMVDTFCEFSFDYRNTKNIDVGDISITPKELLLKNLAKVIEEVELIEIEFNRNNSFNAVVQNKILNNYGYQPELSLETGKVVNKNIQLENKFDYQKFVEDNQFKKPIVLDKKEELILEPIIEKIERQEEQSSGGGISMLEVVLVLIMVLLLMFGTMAYYGHALQQQRSNEFTSQIIKLKAGVDALYANQGNYENLNNQTILNTYISEPDKLFTPWNKKIHLKTNDAKDEVIIEIPLDKDDLENSCKTIIPTINTFDLVKLDNFVVKDGEKLDLGNFFAECLSGKHPNISLITRNK
jgi:hypothetical protein